MLTYATVLAAFKETALEENAHICNLCISHYVQPKDPFLTWAGNSISSTRDYRCFNIEIYAHVYERCTRSMNYANHAYGPVLDKEIVVYWLWGNCILTINIVLEVSGQVRRD